jgi:hypothetical protein
MDLIIHGELYLIEARRRKQIANFVYDLLHSRKKHGKHEGNGRNV